MYEYVDVIVDEWISALMTRDGCVMRNNANNTGDIRSYKLKMS